MLVVEIFGFPRSSQFEWMVGPGDVNQASVPCRCEEAAAELHRERRCCNNARNGWPSDRCCGDVGGEVEEEEKRLLFNYLRCSDVVAAPPSTLTSPDPCKRLRDCRNALHEPLGTRAHTIAFLSAKIVPLDANRVVYRMQVALAVPSFRSSFSSAAYMLSSFGGIAILGPICCMSRVGYRFRGSPSAASPSLTDTDIRDAQVSLYTTVKHFASCTKRRPRHTATPNTNASTTPHKSHHQKFLRPGTQPTKVLRSGL